MFTLYFAPNTIALSTHIALETVGADYKAVRIDFSRSEQRSPEFLRINPKGRVPALVTPQGILTETPAMLLYVSQCFPQAGLAPLDDPFALAQIISFNTYLCSTVHIAHAHRMRGYRWVDQNDTAAITAMQKKVPQNIGDCFEYIERDVFKGPWVMGKQYSISDIYLFNIAQWLEADGVDIERFPQVASHRRSMLQSPIVSKVLSAELAAR